MDFFQLNVKANLKSKTSSGRTYCYKLNQKKIPKIYEEVSSRNLIYHRNNYVDHNWKVEGEGLDYRLFSYPCKLDVKGESFFKLRNPLISSPSIFLKIH